MGQIAKRVPDKRLLKLIRAFLNTGVSRTGWSAPAWEVLPKGDHGLSPIDF
jgi:RNA-directed DNA polymerase